MTRARVRLLRWWWMIAVVGVIIGLSTPTVAADGIGTTVDGRYSSIGTVGSGDQFDVVVVGRGGVPTSGVAAVALNVTATEATAPSFLTVYATGQPRPSTSTLNFVAGQTVANTVVVPVGTDGQVTVFNYSGAVNVVIDVLGWFPTGSSFHAVTPARLTDTRPGYPTIDATAAGAGPLTPGGVRVVPVAGRGGVPASGAASVVLNVTETNPTASSFFTVWASGTPRPATSNLNMVPGQTAANMVVAPLGADGDVDVYNYDGSVDLVVDVLGWFPPGAGFSPVPPARLLDTRPASPTMDGHDSGIGPLGPHAAFDLQVTGRAAIPATGVAAVVIDVTATSPTADGFITVWPSQTQKPNASNLNFVAGQTAASLVIVPVGPDGRVSVGNYSGNSEVIVDVLGWMPADGSFIGLTPARLVDTRPVALPVCTGNTLDAQASPYIDGALGNTKLIVQVTNIGATPCQLQNTPPTLTAIAANGTLVPFPSGGDQTYFGAPQPFPNPLAVGGVAEVWIGGGQPGACPPLGATQTWPAMLLGFADGSTTRFTSVFDTKCGVRGITRFGQPS